MDQLKNETDDAKKQIFEKVATVASTFGSPVRLKILYLLAQAPRSVDSVAKISGESVANVSQHLQKLLREGLVIMKKEKLSRIYRLRDDVIGLLIEDLFDLTEKISPDLINFKNSLNDSNVETPVTLSSVINEIKKDRAIMLDVRDEYESTQTSVDGALSFPIELLKEKAKTLKKNKNYYLFCRGRACELATEGVYLLRSLGFNAFRLKESPSVIRDRINSKQI